MSQPIQVEPTKDDRLIVRFPYSPDRVAKIKAIPGRLWHERERYWTVPGEPGMRERIVALLTSPAPPAGGTVIDRLRAAIRARHFSPETEKAYVHWAERFLRNHPAA